MLNWFNGANIATTLNNALSNVTHAMGSFAGSVTRGQYDPLIFDHHQNAANSCANTIYTIGEMAATFVVVPWVTRSLWNTYRNGPYKKEQCQVKVSTCEDFSTEDLAKIGLHWASNLWVMQPVKWAARGLNFLLRSPIRFLSYQFASQFLYHVVGLKNLWLAMKPAGLALLRPPLERLMPLISGMVNRGNGVITLRAIFSFAGEGTLLTTLSKPLIGLRSLYRHAFVQQSMAEKIAPNLYRFSEQITDGVEWGLVTLLGYFKGIGRTLPAIGSGSNGVEQAFRDAGAWFGERFGGALQTLLQQVSPTLDDYGQWTTDQVSHAGGRFFTFVNQEILWNIANQVGGLVSENPYAPNIVYGAEMTVLMAGTAYGVYKGSGHLKSLGGWGLRLTGTCIEKCLHVVIEKAFGGPSISNTNVNHVHPAGAPQPGTPPMIFNQINNQHEINNGYHPGQAADVPPPLAPPAVDNDAGVVEAQQPPGPAVGVGV